MKAKRAYYSTENLFVTGNERSEPAAGSVANT